MSQQLEQSRSELEQRVEQATLAMREQRDTAERANSAKTRFLAAASHDLRQPMHALNLLLTALQHEHAKPMREELLQRIDATSKAMSGLLDALLDISRLDAGGVKPQLETFELLPLLLNVRDTYEGLAQIKGVELHVRLCRLWVRSDPMLVERILGNFVSNAIRYTPAGGRVLVAVRQRGQCCLLQVRDNGPGIEAKDHQAIFEEFIQIHNPQRDRSLGLGLGLAIVKRLAQLLDHPLELRSCPGQGSTFAIELPTRHKLASNVQRAEVTQGEPNIPAAHVSLSILAGCRILLVEDDTQIRESYELLLRLWGCEVSSFASAGAALEQLGRHGWTPQIIVADYRLGGSINGVELITAVRRQLSPTIPAVLVTGNTEQPELRQLRDLTIRILFKPVKSAELMATLHELLLRAQIANPGALADPTCN
jgi:CheY-like chemotaxis protein